MTEPNDSDVPQFGAPPARTLAETPKPKLGWRAWVPMLVFVLVVGGFVLWQSGLIQGVFTKSPKEALVGAWVYDPCTTATIDLCTLTFTADGKTDIVANATYSWQDGTHIIISAGEKGALTPTYVKIEGDTLYFQPSVITYQEVLHRKK